MEVAIIRIDNPPLNILSKKTRLNILHQLNIATSDAKIGAILIVGTEGYFSAGADINEMRDGRGISSAHSFIEAYKSHNLASVVYAFDSSPKPVVALLSGMVIGGGLEIALGCHYRMCLNNTTFKFPEVMIGIIPGALGTQLLPRLVDFETCIRMCARGDTIDADEAFSVGLVDQLIAKEVSEPFADIIEKAKRVLERHLQGGPHAPSPYLRTSSLFPKTNYHTAMKIAFLANQMIPSAYNGGQAPRAAIQSLLACIRTGSSFLSGALIESEIQRHLIVSTEAQALRYAYFSEKMAPQTTISNNNNKNINNWSKNSDNDSSILSPLLSSSTPTPTPIPTSPLPHIQHVGVLGGGFMGCGIAAGLLSAGLTVTLSDVSEDVLSRAKTEILRILSTSKVKAIKSASNTSKPSSSSHLNEVSKLPKENESNKRRAEEIIRNQLLIDTNMNSFSHCDLVIEAVFEDKALKKKLFQQLDAICTPSCILCSNTSSLDINDLATAVATSRMPLVAGMHFFSPVHHMRLVECIKGSNSSFLTVQAVMALAKRMGKLGVLVGSCPGFVGNRMIYPYILESMLLLEDGVPVGRVDQVARDFGWAIGPLQMSDMAGLDVGYKVRQEMGLVNPETRPTGIRYSDIGDRLVALGRYGMKNGKGFYNYQKKTSGTSNKHQKSSPQNKMMTLPQVDQEVEAIIIASSTTTTTRSKSASNNQSLQNHISDEEILDRLLLPIINEGFLILEEGIVVSDRWGDIDVILLNGYAWPRYKGGPMYFANHFLGLKLVFQKLSALSLIYSGSNYFRPAPLLIKMVSCEYTLEDLTENKKLLSQLRIQIQNEHTSKL